ncbi:MAG: hypothetical protein HND48_13700 [Chloroflexi bacterium]|nr:hypothetical protein [Chloroflexota bacterium]
MQPQRNHDGADDGLTDDDRMIQAGERLRGERLAANPGGMSTTMTPVILYGGEQGIQQSPAGRGPYAVQAQINAAPPRR